MAESHSGGGGLKVVVGERNFAPHRDLFESLLPVGVDTSWHAAFDEAALVTDLADADVYIGGRVTPSMARAGSRLRLVLTGGAGTDKVSFDDLPAHTLVANTFHHEDSIAEYIAAAAVTVRRDLLVQDAALRQGVWASAVYRDGVPQPQTLRGAMVGYVGFGHIGRRTADLLGAFGARACAVTGSGRVADDSGLEWHGDTTDLGRLMTESDVVVVSAPLTSSTTGMIDAAHLRRLGPSGVLVNVGRGPLVVEQDLFEALQDGVIGGAAVDVWYRYPTAGDEAAPSDLPFAELPNVLMTPHISGVTRDTFVGRVHDITDNISRLLAGRDILRVVTPS
ncbi:2-hydroxyacid dehydrogenase [Gordonia terrae]|uniref:Hydroxyacid dehydrogenase n=2 Tax=Gordonia terrae TaxID=2055 RepID=A0AAD0P037_9ACTN|nr:2-hydroxyacid dehydrogenase [Gordonia terrae]VTR07641.1 2-hydroxyacid dehydrogenase [Clostridioides difficile]ANY23904.1 hydroxyacid dehydrogenase [Gordonia terrae]AWO84639.1 hydroxyacid dehydrogenase [Gordonia terrae]VTS55731.1 Glycerate dehydrogenase [Gordonia terrae]GAB43073.1 putative oxidoreductase [Gordonia terrae NBRC 100016]